MRAITIFIILLANIVFGQTVQPLAYNAPKKNVIEANTNYAVIKKPLSIINGMAFFEAKLDNTTGNYLFDTGAPMLILNKKMNSNHTMRATSISGELPVASTRAKHFSWAGNTYLDVEAIAIDLSHLEQSANINLAGIIGYEVLKNYEVFIDYPSGQVAILSPGNNPLTRTAEPRQVVPFEQTQHLPVVNVVIDGKVMRFGIDSGAAINVIDQKYSKQLSELSFSLGEAEELRGLDQRTIEVETGVIHQTTIGDLAISDMKFLFVDLARLEMFNGLQLDGLLGYPFLRQVKCSINFPRRELIIW